MPAYCIIQCLTGFLRRRLLAMDCRQAEVVVAAISRSDAELATKSGLKAEMSNLKAEVFRALWLQGAGIVGLVVGLTKLL